MTRTPTPTAAVGGELPVLHDDPFGHDVLEDPTDFHHRLREAGSVVYLDRYNVYALGRYEHVHAALTDWQTFQSGAGVGLDNFRYDKPWRPPSLLLETDPPVHDAPRAVLSDIMRPRALHGLRDAWFADAERLVDDLLRGRGADGAVEVDAVAALAEAFPLRVFPDAVGLPAEGREHLLPYGDHLFNAFGPKNDLRSKGDPRAAELSAWVNEQCARDVLSADGFGAQIWAAADRGDITHEQAPVIVRSLLSAGVDTTVHGLSAVLQCFVEAPEQWARLRAEPSLARIAFDEAVRLHAPVQTFFRTATVEVAIDGHVVPDGKKMVMFFGSANRDPRRWENPDVFDLGRDPSGHVGFGMGIHQCVGQHVARLEAEALLTALAARVTLIEPAGPVRRHHNNTLRAPAALPVRLYAT